MPKIRICHPKLKQRVWLYVEDDVWHKKLRHFAEKILELDEPISIRSAAKEADVHRKTAGKYLNAMEKSGLLTSLTKGVYFVAAEYTEWKLGVNLLRLATDFLRNYRDPILAGIESALDFKLGGLRQLKADRKLRECALETWD